MAITFTSGEVQITGGARGPLAATAGTANTITGNFGSANVWVGRIIWITGGTGIGQSRHIVLNTSTVATVDIDWDVAPDATSTWIVGYRLSDIITAVPSQVAWDVSSLSQHALSSVSIRLLSGAAFSINRETLSFGNGRTTLLTDVGSYFQAGFPASALYPDDGLNGGAINFLIINGSPAYWTFAWSGSMRFHGTALYCARGVGTTFNIFAVQNGASIQSTGVEYYDCSISGYAVNVQAVDTMVNTRGYSIATSFGADTSASILANPTRFAGNTFPLNPRPSTDGVYSSGVSGGDIIDNRSIVAGSTEMFLFNFTIANGGVVYLWNPLITNAWTAIGQWYNNTASYDGHIYRGYLVGLSTRDNLNAALSITVGVFDTNGDGAILTGKTGLLPDRSETITTNGSGVYEGVVGTGEGLPILYARYVRASEFVSTELLYANYTMVVKKYGYVSQVLQKSWDERSQENLTIFSNSVVVLSEAAALALTGVVFDGVGKTITHTGSLSASELYDASQAWAATTTNFKYYDDPFISTDRVNFTLSTGWTLILDTAISGGISVIGDVILTANINLTAHNVYGTLELTTAGTYVFNDMVITDVTNSSGGVIIINTSGGLSVTTDPATGPNVTINTPTTALTIDPDINITGAIRYFRPAISEQTPADSDTGNTLAYTYTDTDPIDIEVVEQGYVPENFQNVTPINGAFNIEMDFDEAYNASHGLSIPTNFTYDRATKALAILADQNALDIRSALADEIRLTPAYFNTKLLMDAIPGLVRVDLTNGMTCSTMDKWKGAGMERFTVASSANAIEKWLSVQSVGGITGATTHHRQANSGVSTAIALTSNVVNESFQYWSDPNVDGNTADGYNKSDYLLIKAFKAGSKQGRIDVLANSGSAALKSTLYVVPLANVAHDYAGVDHGISGDITLIPRVGAVGGKTFAYEIVDGGTNSGQHIADQFNWNAAQDPNTVIPGGTGLRYFEMPDMVIYNATAVETANGIKEGVTPTAVGFYVSRGGVDHPSFTRFQADDGTYYTPAVTANIGITGLLNAVGASRNLQILNLSALSAADWSGGLTVTEGSTILRSTGIGTEFTAGLFFRASNGGTTHATTEPTWNLTPGATTTDNGITWTCYKVLFYDADPAATGYSASYIDGEEIKAGETYDIRFAEMDGTTSFKSGRSTGIAATSGFTVAMTLETDLVYATWALLEGQDGAFFDATFSPDYILNYVVLDTNTDFSGKSLGLYYCYILTTSAGMHRFWGGVTLVDAGNLRNNDDVVDIYLDETAGFVKQTDNVRIYKKINPNTRPALDPTTGTRGLEMVWRNQVFTNVVNTTGSPVITGDITAIPGYVQTGMTNQGYTTARSATIDTVATIDGKVDTTNKILKNKNVTNPVTGKQTIYDDDDVTPLLEADAFEDVAGATLYQGNGINRRDRLV